MNPQSEKAQSIRTEHKSQYSKKESLSRRSRNSFFKSFGTFRTMKSLKETEQERREREKLTYAQKAARNRSLYSLALKQEEINKEKVLVKLLNLKDEWHMVDDVIMRSGSYEEKLLTKTKVTKI